MDPNKVNLTRTPRSKQPFSTAAVCNETAELGSGFLQTHPRNYYFTDWKTVLAKVTQREKVNSIAKK